MRADVESGMHGVMSIGRVHIMHGSKEKLEMFFLNRFTYVVSDIVLDHVGVSRMHDMHRSREML